MAKKELNYRPKDTNQLAKYITDLATGEIKDEDKKDKHKVPEKKKKTKE